MPLRLAVDTNQPSATLDNFLLAASKTYELQLVDCEGRTNKLPAQFVFDALKNRTPELKVASPARRHPALPARRTLVRGDCL